MKINFKFDGHYDYEESKWKYSYESNADKITIRDINSDCDNIHVDIDLENNDNDTTKEDNYINELSLISSSTFDEKAVKDIFKKIGLKEIDYSNTDKNGNITLYKFNKSVLPVYIRAGYNEDKPNTYSYEEIEALKKKYEEFDSVEHTAFNDVPDDILTNMFITSVELVKNNVFKDHDVYYLYVTNKCIYEEFTNRELQYPMLWDIHNMRVTNYLTKERIGKCIYCLQNEKENC